ncbi:MAG: hypothetical protein Rubg2KO_25740 [Rubricoccaceae bacterium]
MKLRIKGDSIRLRLTQTEVRQLAETGEVESAMHVGTGTALTYGVCAADSRQLEVAWFRNGLTLRVPRTWIGPWADGDGVGFEGTQDAGDGRTLAILIEKDFDCLHKRPDEQDAFPNPLADAV